MRGPGRKPLIERLQEKFVVDPDSGCWVWHGFTSGVNRQPCMWNGTRYELAVRIAYRLHRGSLPPGRLYRSCDHQQCINPDHVLATIVDRFWSMVHKSDGCWLWTGDTSGGYGAIKDAGRKIMAHRFSYKLHYGPIEDGKLVLHQCDVPQCVRPDHLFVGTDADNQRDCFTKGRGGRRQSVSPEQVRQIRQLAKTLRPFQVAQQLTLSYASVRSVIRGESYAFVK